MTSEIFVEAKVFQLGDIVENLHKKVMDLELHAVTHSTPPKVLKERIKETTKDVKRIEEVEALYAKVLEQDSQTWESLIENEELENVIEQLCTTEIEVNQIKK